MRRPPPLYLDFATDRRRARRGRQIRYGLALALILASMAYIVFSAPIV